MTSKLRVPPAEITGPYGALIKKLTKKRFGEVPDGIGVMWHNRRVLKTSMANGQKTKRWNTCDESRGAPGDERGRTITGLGPGGHDEAEYQHNDRNEADQKGVVITAAVERSSLVVHFREVPRHHDHPRQACECRTSRRRCKRSTEARGSD